MNDEIENNAKKFWILRKERELTEAGIFGKEKNERMIPSQATIETIKITIQEAKKEAYAEVFKELDELFERGFSYKISRFILYPSEWKDIKENFMHDKK